MEMTCLEHRLKAADGTELFVREYPPATGSANELGRTLLVVHGAAEHGGRYEQFAATAAEAGWRVIVPDLRGHGESAGVHVHVDRFSRYLEDLTFLCEHFRVDSRRLACLGHSLGGLIVARLVQTHPRLAVAAVLLSPLFEVAIKIPWTTLWAGRTLALVIPKLRFSSRIKPSELTADTESLEKRKQDPLMRRGVTAGWFVQTQRAMQEAFRDAPEMQIPLLVLHGGLDRIADPLAAQRWAETAGGRDKRMQLFSGHLHELLNEPDGPETATLILDWLEKRIPRSI